MKSAGLVDLQANGFAGVDFNIGASLTAAQLDVALEAILATGVTCLLPTIITATEAQLSERLAALDAAITASALGPMMCPGYHLEGPFLNPSSGFAGCHPPEAMVAPDYTLVERLERGLARPILLITIAPELTGAEAFIRRARKAGKLVAIGHSAADFDETRRAADAGIGLATHVGNGLPQMLPKFANPIMAQLAENRLMTSFIADGIHIPPEALKVLIRAADPERSLLVTDAVSAASAPAGLYPFAGLMVERGADGTVRLPGQVGLAGSSLCLDTAMRNLVDWSIATPAEALAMACTRPAALLAPALSAHGLTQMPGDLTWSGDLYLEHLRLGVIERPNPVFTSKEKHDVA